MSYKMSISRTTESDSFGSDDEEDYYSKFSSHGGVKSMLLFQFEPQFSIVIVASICLSYITVLVDAAFALGTNVDNIPKEYSTNLVRLLYAFDIVYFFDLISMTIFRRVNWLDVKYRHQPRNGFILFLEYVTVIPIDGIYYTSTNRSIQVVYILRLRYALRILRLLTYYKRGRTYVGGGGYIFQLMFVLFVIFFIVITMSTLGYILECRSRQNCTYADITLLNNIIYTCFTKLTIMGGTNAFKDTFDFPFVWIIVYMAYLCNVFLISNFTCDIIQLMNKKFTIVHNYERIEQALFVWLEQHTKHKNFFKRYKAVIQEIYTLFWSRKSGIHFQHVRSYMPEVMYKEMAFDLSWAPLKHMHIFRNEDIHYLRFISFFFVHTFYAPGVIIYKKNQYKSRMIYIVSGVVDILSEEDNETPIISFSDGTCLGESTLIIDYRSTVTVICKGFCEVAILEKKKFITASKLYPTKIANARTIITNRYIAAKRLTLISKYQIHKTNMNIDEITMRWMKYILRKLLQFTHKADQKYTKSKFHNLMFHTNYLDLLAIAEELALVTDSIFLQKNFPFIFQPASIFITVWNRLIFIVFTIFSVLYLLNISVVDSISSGYIIFHIIVSILWVIDIYITVSTAVRTSNFYYTTLSDIAVYRLMTPSFVLDVLAAVSPASFLMIMGSTISTRLMIITECNKLLKFYKTKDTLDATQTKSTTMLVLNKYIKFVYYLSLITLYMAGIIHMSVCYDTKCQQDYKKYMIRNSATRPLTIIYLEIYSVCKFLCNFERMANMYGESYYVLFVVQIVLYVYNLYFISTVSAAETLKILDRHNLNDYVFSLDIGMKSTDVSYEVQDYIWSHVRTMYQYSGFNFLYGSVIYENLPRYLVDMSNHIKYGDYIKQIPLFQQTDDAIVKFAASLVEERIIPKYGLMVSEQDICNEMHIIIAGYCKITSNGESKIIGPGKSFNVLEMCLKATAISTVESVTCCLIMSMNYENYTKIAIQYPTFHNEIENALDTIRRDAQEVCKQEHSIQYTKRTKKIHQYTYFGKRTKHKRSDEYNCAFSKLNMPLKYLLLPITFAPHNPYILGWELLRCISAMAYWFILPINIVNPCASCTSALMITILDVIAVVDIYIRHHIWYYSEDGIEITHPLYTARHYWKNSFLMDALQTFPFNSLHLSQKTNMFFLLLRANRLLQIRRVYGLIDYTCKYRIQITRWEYLKHLPNLVWILNVLTAIQFNAYCYYTDTTTVQCFNDSSITSNITMDHYTSVKNYISNLFLMTSYFTNTYFSHSTNFLLLSKILMTISAFLGYFFWGAVTAKMVAICMSKNDDLFYFHDSLRELLKYMTYRRIDRRLKRELINHFNNMWHKKKGKNIIELIKYFSKGVQTDILFQTFGNRMCGSMVFSIEGSGAIRSLLHYASHEMILNHGIIYRVNDVLGKIFYLYKGQVEVLGPDLKHLDFLYSGSLFGNLDNCAMSRQTVTVVACGHVELLSFPSVEFHKVLSHYPDIMNYFRRLTCINVDYVEDKISKNSKTKLISLKKLKSDSHTFKYNNTMKAWRSLITILSYISFILEMYHIITLEHAIPIIVTLYAIDVAHVVKIFLALHTAYEDEYGLIIMNKQKISSKYHREIFGFYFDLCSVIPIEIVCVVFAGSHKLMLSVWSYMRVNRLIRIAFFIKNTSNISQKVNVVVYIFRTIHIFLWLSIVHFLLACIIFFIDSFTIDMYKISSMEKFLMLEQDINLVISMMMKITITYDRELRTPIEVFIILSAILSRFLSMHLLAELVTTLQIANTNKYNLQKFALQLNTYMANENISYPLHKKLYRYVTSLWSFNRGMQVPRLLEKAPYYLQEALLNSLFGIHLRKHPIFSKCHIDLIRQMAAKLKTQYFFPGDIITYIGDIDHCMYFIQEGEIEALSEDSMYSEVVDEVLRSGDTFGFEQCIRLRCGHEYTYKVTTNTVVLVLKREDWIYLLDFFPASKVTIYGFGKIEK